MKKIKIVDKLQELLKINIALSEEKNTDKLLEKIVVLARIFTNADGGTLYIKDDIELNLKFKFVQTQSLKIKFGGYSGKKLDWLPLPLYKQNNIPNSDNISVMSALNGNIINIKDVYSNKDFNFEGAKQFDLKMDYYTKSMLVIPLKDTNNNTIGVLQLINKHSLNKDFKVPCNKQDCIEFDLFDEHLASALASQAAIYINNARLIEELEAFMHGFIKSIGIAIDEKSPYTGGHVKQVGKITKLLAEAVNNDKTIFKDKNYNKVELDTLEMAAWLHDVGKIAVPDHIMDKATKLEKITNRIDIIKERIEILKRDFKIQMLENKIDKIDYFIEISNLTDDFLFLEKINIGGEFLADSDIEKISKIANKEYILFDKKVKLLRDDEVKNLSIKKGTLLPKERDIITNHAQMTYNILKRLPFPKKYKNMVNIASNHHEKINGKGYPRGLKGDEISIEDRILAIADIFEALTAHDRPYKKAKKLSEVFKILSFMVKDGELDKDLIELFFREKLYEKYAKNNLFPEQIDEPKLFI